MNENRETNLPENNEVGESTQAFNPDFNDTVVDTTIISATNSKEVVNNSTDNQESDNVTESADISTKLINTETSDMDAGVEIGDSEVVEELSEVKNDYDDVVKLSGDSSANPDQVENVEQSPENTPPIFKKRSNHRYTTKALIKESNIALILSAASIILMLALAALLVSGILPVGNRMVYVSVSNLGTVEPPASLATADTLEDAKRSVVIVYVTKASSSGTGSGIIISKDGYIVTNYHVIEGAKSVKLKLYQSEKNVSATVVGYSERDDIAVLKADLDDARAATFAKSEACRVGDVVYSIGAPEGAEFGWTVTSGIISEPVREVWIYNDSGMLDKKMFLLQTDASVNPGNSGGPLINARGEVVGIITMKRSNAAGLGFALPSSASLEIIEAILKDGNADNVVSKISKDRPLIGIGGVGIPQANVWYADTPIGYSEVDDAYVAANPDSCIIAEVAGVYVLSLTPGLDAENHLLVGDVITHVNGTAVAVTQDIINIINNYNGGDIVTITFGRDGNTQTVEITLGTEK